jgi:hypothetical protein
MCTFKDERAVLVCDVAISHVRETVDAVFGNAVHYTMVEGQGTLVEVNPTVDTEQFQALTHTAIAAAQDMPLTIPDQEL